MHRFSLKYARARINFVDDLNNGLNLAALYHDQLWLG